MDVIDRGDESIFEDIFLAHSYFNGLLAVQPADSVEMFSFKFIGFLQ
jgi:hypothetical protein